MDGGVGLLQALGARFLDAQGEAVGAGRTGTGADRVRRRDGSRSRALRDLGSEYSRGRDQSALRPVGGGARGGGQEGRGPGNGPPSRPGSEAVRRGDPEINGEGREENRRGGGSRRSGRRGTWAFNLDAEIRPGVDLVIERTNLEKNFIACDLVIAGEGRTNGRPCAARPRSASPGSRKNTAYRPCVCPGLSAGTWTASTERGSPPSSASSTGRSRPERRWRAPPSSSSARPKTSSGCS